MARTENQSSEPTEQVPVADSVEDATLALAESDLSPISSPTLETKELRKPRVTNQRGRVGGGGSPA